jgi:hypothetical protein
MIAILAVIAHGRVDERESIRGRPFSNIHLSSNAVGHVHSKVSRLCQHAGIYRINHASCLGIDTAVDVVTGTEFR